MHGQDGISLEGCIELCAFSKREAMASDSDVEEGIMLTGPGIGVCALLTSMK
jgi:hypothetical protein